MTYVFDFVTVLTTGQEHTGFSAKTLAYLSLFLFLGLAVSQCNRSPRSAAFRQRLAVNVITGVVVALFIGEFVSAHRSSDVTMNFLHAAFLVSTVWLVAALLPSRAPVRPVREG
jgi:heme A synthase